MSGGKAMGGKAGRAGQDQTYWPKCSREAWGKAEKGDESGVGAPVHAAYQMPKPQGTGDPSDTPEFHVHCDRFSRVCTWVYGESPYNLLLYSGSKAL